MNVFVVNLERSADRRSRVTRHLQEMGIDFELLRAVDGRSLSERETSEKVDQRWAKRHIGRHLFPGEIGCALSHLLIYKRMIDRDLPIALILEDDAVLLPCTQNVITEVAKRVDPNEPRVILLSEVEKISAIPFATVDGFTCAAVLSAAYLTHGYIVTLDAARRMLALLFPVVQVADDWGWISMHTGIQLLAFDTPLAKQHCGNSDVSTITDERVEKRSEPARQRTSLAWWRLRLYRRFWQSIDRVGLGYSYWRAK